MKNDNQHLDYLISQYVDGCLDPAGKKLVEQQLLNDPEARKLYKEQRDTQDLLDDWGNRIPMINWEEFEKKLALKLQNETVGGRAASFFRRWGRYAAVAAALLLAAGFGYLWHGSGSQTLIANTPVPTLPAITAHTSFEVVDAPKSDQPWGRIVEVSEPAAGASQRPQTASVSITAPGDVAAMESLRETLAWGMLNLSDSVRIQQSKDPRAVQAVLSPKPDKDYPPIP